MKLFHSARIVGFGLGAIAVTTLTGCSNDDAAQTPAAAGPSAIVAAPSAPSGSQPATTAPTAASKAPEKKPHSKKLAAPLGKIISTGMDVTPATEWVIYGQSVSNKNTPKTKFGFALGERFNNGTITQYTDIYEATTSDLAPGFHVPERAYTLEGDIEQPAYGYFVGSPAKITGTVDGKTVVAKRAVWSEKSSVTVFWFDTTTVTGDTTLTSVQAYDRAGKKTAETRVYGIGE